MKAVFLRCWQRKALLQVTNIYYTEKWIPWLMIGLGIMNVEAIANSRNEAAQQETSNLNLTI
jgi:hypothetical protein